MGTHRELRGDTGEPHPRGSRDSFLEEKSVSARGRAEGVRKERNAFQAEVTRAKVRRPGGLPPWE